MTTHRLKIFVKYADAIMSGAKTFEIRKNDRGYEIGDKIVFHRSSGRLPFLPRGGKAPIQRGDLPHRLHPRWLRGPCAEVRGARHF